MKTMALALAFAVVALHGVAAQGPVAGNWRTEFDTGIRSVNGVETSTGKRQARIVLRLTGDSVTGTWQALADSTAPAGKAIQLRGKIAGGRVQLQADPVEHVRMINGDQQRVRMIDSYSFVLHGDVLEGTVQTRSVDGSFERNARPFSAKREKN